MDAAKLERDGSWRAPPGSPFRSLTPLEVAELREMAERTTPIFGGPHNVTWEETHPVAREVYQRRGLQPA